MISVYRVLKASRANHLLVADCSSFASIAGGSIYEVIEAGGQPVDGECAPGESVVLRLGPETDLRDRVEVSALNCCVPVVCHA